MSELDWLSHLPRANRTNITEATLVVDRVECLFFSRELDNGMTLIVRVPKHEFEVLLDHRNIAALLGVLALIVLTLAVALYVLTYRVNRPIKRLLAGVEALGRGQLDTELEVHGRDELSLLASTFNSMTSDLKLHIRHLQEVTASKERIESELKVAQEIQMGILPSVLPPFPKCDYFEVDAFLVPAREVGGDLYDLFLLSPTKIGLVVGDVSGKGVPASLFMAVTQTLHRGLTRGDRTDPAELVIQMNKVLCTNNSALLFVTYMFAILDLTTGEMTYCNAGHNPFVAVKRDGSVYVCDQVHGLPLGIEANQEYKEATVKLDVDEKVFFYTDGVTEAKNENDELFDMKRLVPLLKQCGVEGLSAAKTNEAVRRALAEYVGSAHQSDDITMLSLKLTALKASEKEKQEQKS